MIDENNKNIFQIFISDMESYKSDLVEDIKNSIKYIHSDHHLHFITNADARDIIISHFDRPVIEAYDNLEPYSYKADLLKYCLLYRFGGMTIDLSILPARRLEIPAGKKILCFRDAFGHDMSPWAMATNLILSYQGRDEFKYAIDLIVSHCKNHYYGANCLDPTGPGVFGRALTAIDQAKDLEVGEFRNLSGGGNGGFGFIDRNGSILALRMKTIGADLAHIGLKGTNNYAEMYRSNNIYKRRNIEISCQDGSLNSPGEKSVNGIYIKDWMSNALIYGPYIALNKGSYRATYLMDDKFRFNSIVMDVFSQNLGQIATREHHWKFESELSIDFDLAVYCSALEIRLWSSGGASGYCKSLKIERLE